MNRKNASDAAPDRALSGGHGVQEFSCTAVSLVELVLLIIPLTAITFGVTQLTPERGGAELLFSQTAHYWGTGL